MGKYKIFVGAPVRNRAWVLYRYINALKRQNIEMETCFIVNDSVDDTESIMRNNGFKVIVKNFGGDTSHARGKYSKNNLAILRNILLEEFLKSDCNFLFSVDTDIIIPDESLIKLINHNKDIVSMLIKNHPTLKAHNIFVNGTHLTDVPAGLIPVDMTGAVYLISRRVIEKGVKYSDHELGEDIPFCQMAKEKRFELFCDTRLKPIHVYNENLELVAKTSSSINSLLELLGLCQKLIPYLENELQNKNYVDAIKILKNFAGSINTITQWLVPYFNVIPNTKIKTIIKYVNQVIEIFINMLQNNEHGKNFSLEAKDLKQCYLNLHYEAKKYLIQYI
jgi:hypothetical protein